MNESKRAIIGSPDDVVAELERVRAKVGDFGAVLIFQNDWANWPATLRSLELIAEEVRPRLNGTNWLRQDSYDRNAPKIKEIRDSARQGIEAAQARFDANRKSK